MNEYEKTIMEALHFDEHEFYQQPFGHILMCSIRDDIETIELLKRKDKYPALISEGVYESRMPTIVLVHNDKSDPNSILTNDVVFKKLEMIRNFNSQFYVVCCDINGNKDGGFNDVWTKYIHRLDFYSSNNINISTKNNINNNNIQDITNSNNNVTGLIQRGQLITIEEKEIFKGIILKFFNEYIKPYLQKLVFDLDEEVTNNKKGFKNGFLNIFKKSEKVEYVNGFNIYKVNII
jgi:hypothetical protein